MLADPDILVATRPVLPWTNAQAYVRTDGDAKRVSGTPAVCVRSQGRNPMVVPHHKSGDLFRVSPILGLEPSARFRRLKVL